MSNILEALLVKIDNEGYEGITWFKPEEFDDPKVSTLLDQALGSFEDFKLDFSDLMNYVEEKLDEEHPTDT